MNSEITDNEEEQVIPFGNNTIRKHRFSVEDGFSDKADYGVRVQVTHSPDHDRPEPYADKTGEERIPLLTRHLAALFVGEPPEFLLIGSDTQYATPITQAVCERLTINLQEVPTMEQPAFERLLNRVPAETIDKLPDVVAISDLSSGTQSETVWWDAILLTTSAIPEPPYPGNGDGGSPGADKVTAPTIAVDE